MQAPPQKDSPPARRPKSPIDENVLDGLHRLSRDGRPDLAKTVIRLFLETAPTTLEDLQRGAATKDRDLVARASHILPRPVQLLARHPYRQSAGNWRHLAEAVPCQMPPAGSS